MKNPPPPLEQHRSLIVHGQDAAPGRYPYYVTLDRTCAGALIAPDIVLTAGHCKPASLQAVGQLHVGTYFMDYEQDREQAAAAASGVVVGTSSSSSSSYEQETFGLRRIHRHADWIRRGDDEFVSDFTLLQLDGASSQRPVRINRHPDVPAPQQTVVAMGLGDLSEDADVRPVVLQDVALQYIPNEQCRLADDGQGESFREPADRIGPTHLCTFVADSNNDRDACSYDSGGPIIIPGNDGNNDDDVLVALVSWGIGCADPIFPGVNARVSSVSDWIDDYVCKHSIQPPADFNCGGGTTTATPTTNVPSSSSSSSWSLSFSSMMTGVMMTSLLVLLYFLYKAGRWSWQQTKGRRFYNNNNTYRYLDRNDSDDDDSLDKRFVRGMKRHNTEATAKSMEDDEDTEEDGTSPPVSYQNDMVVVVVPV